MTTTHAHTTFELGCPQCLDTLPWERVSSSNVRAVAWQTETEERGWLWVEFKSGGVYRYGPCAPDLYGGLLAAPSKGRYVAREVRPRYAALKAGARGR